MIPPPTPRILMHGKVGFGQEIEDKYLVCNRSFVIGGDGNRLIVFRQGALCVTPCGHATPEERESRLVFRRLFQDLFSQFGGANRMAGHSGGLGGGNQDQRRRRSER